MEYEFGENQEIKLLIKNNKKERQLRSILGELTAIIKQNKWSINSE